MFGVKFGSDDPFAYTVFGIQYPNGDPSAAQKSRTDEFDALISSHATHIDRLLQHGCASLHSGRTFVWLAYWKSSSDYKRWWERNEVSRFWDSLPADAGVWREVMTPSPRRTQHGTNGKELRGMGHLGERASNVGKLGYWGCYRDRMADSETDSFMAPAQSNLRARRPSTGASSAPGPVRPGRVRLTTFPDNVCFVVEGQDHSSLTPEEKTYWFENFDHSVNQWVTDLMEADAEAGILDGRLCYQPESGVFRNSEPQPLNYNKKVQLFYFRDLRHMEEVGRLHKGHADLRKRFLEAYRPGGPMRAGKICLWVETTVLKADEMECEYVGCEEGTGFMGSASSKSLL